MEPNWLNPREDRAWRALMHAHHPLGVHLNRGLQESGLSAADHEILAVLSDHDGDSMPGRDLCNTLGPGEEPCLPPGSAHAEGRADRPRAQPRRRPAQTSVLAAT
jgi:hypothetical protein